MYTLVFAMLLGQCGPSGCPVPDGPQWRPIVDRTGQPAVLDVEVVPQNGRVWFGETPITLHDGKTRVQTPPLEPGRTYQYRVTAQWGDIVRRWTVTFAPGQTVRMVLRRDDPAPSTSETTAGTSGSSAAPSPASPSQPSSPDAAGRAVPGTTPGELPVIEQDGVQNFGIVRAGLNGSNERITLDGREITRSEAERILQAGSLADDSGKLRLTVIGTEADRRRVLQDLQGPLRDIAEQCLVQDYPPDHWAVTGVGFYTAGRPTIYIQAPDGSVLHRQDDYNDGAEGLRKAFQCLRKPNPNYQPDKDRDLRRPAGGLLSWLFALMTNPFRTVLSWILAAGVVFLLIVLVMKGWLFYLLTLLAKVLPAPPTPVTTAATPTTTTRTKTPATKSRTTKRKRS
jgi:hypothetical protein